MSHHIETFYREKTAKESGNSIIFADGGSVAPNSFSKQIITLTILFIPLFAAFGCNSAAMSTPQMQAMDPAIERARHGRHDPLPLSDLGPETHTRGRDYQTPRTYPRRSQENYSQTIDPNRSPYIPPSPIGSRIYPEIVKE